MVGIVAVVYGLIQAPDVGWVSAQTLLAFAIGAVVIAAFVWWELRVDEPMLDMSYFRVPAFSVGTSGMILVFMAMYGVMFLMTQYFQLVLGYSPLDAAIRLLPLAPIMIVVAPLTPRLSARFGANRTVGMGLFLVGVGMILFRGLDQTTAYAQVLVTIFPLASGIALAMSPMTAAIMSAVPARRAGAGSAMNDASRELGAALGIAVMGSIAASRYASHVDQFTRHLPAATQTAARSSLADALAAADRLGGRAGALLHHGAQEAFLSGTHLAVTIGAALSFSAAVIVVRYLPRHLEPESAIQGPVEAIEDTAELGLAGVPPVFAEQATEADAKARLTPAA